MQQFEHAISLAGKQARYYDFSDPSVDDTHNSIATKNAKPILHFYGGNGFPVGVYQPLLTTLHRQFDVISLAMRGYWYDLPSDNVLSREQDANLLIEFLQKTQDKPVVGIGHSQGATATAMAAAKRPDLFSSLYFIDPVTFTKAQQRLYSRLPRWLLLTQEPFKSTKVKQADWESIEDYYQHLRQHRAFKRMSDEHLSIFAQHSLVANTGKEDKDGYTLLFQPEQELASYFGTPYINAALKQLNKHDLPYHLIVAKPSVFNSGKVRKSWRKFVDPEKITTLSDYGHLLPMEAPERCAKIITDLEAAH